MLRLLNIELHKLRYNRAAKVLVIIYFALFFSLVLFSTIHFNFGPIDFQLADQGIFNFPYIWHFTAYFTAILKIFLAVVIVSMIATEFTDRTLKQNLIDGLSKKEFIGSKFYTIILFSLASTILLFIVTLGLGLIFSDYTEPNIIFSGMGYIGGYFLKLVAFFTFCFFLGVLVKRSAFALGALFVWWIFEGIVKIIVKLLVHKYQFHDWITQFLPLNAMSNLVKQPFTELNAFKSVVHSTGAQITFDTTIHTAEVIIVLVWTALFLGGSYWLINKRDL